MANSSLPLQRLRFSDPSCRSLVIQRSRIHRSQNGIPTRPLNTTSMKTGSLYLTIKCSRTRSSSNGRSISAMSSQTSRFHGISVRDRKVSTGQSKPPILAKRPACRCRQSKYLADSSRPVTTEQLFSVVPSLMPLPANQHSIWIVHDQSIYIC